MQVLIGTPNDDEMVGGYTSEVLIGGKGADTLLRWPGHRHRRLLVEHRAGARHPGRRHADRPGPRDPARPDPDDPIIGESRTERAPRLPAALPQRSATCRRRIRANRASGHAGDRDCTADDGAWDGTTSEGDCVGEDVENIVGSDFDDILIGNDVDPLEGRGPRVEPLGANRIQGGDGDDVMDGRSGPDVYEGGAGTDTVTYGGSGAGRAAHSPGEPACQRDDRRGRE